MYCESALNGVNHLYQVCREAADLLRCTCYTVEYAEDLHDNGWCASAERFAHYGKAPLRWLCNDYFHKALPAAKDEASTVLFKLQNIVVIDFKNSNIDPNNGFRSLTGSYRSDLVASGAQKVCRTAVFFFSLIVAPLSIALMATAFLNEEIRCKYQIVNKMDDENVYIAMKRLTQLVNERVVA